MPGKALTGSSNVLSKLQPHLVQLCLELLDLLLSRLRRLWLCLLISSFFVVKRKQYGVLFKHGHQELVVVEAAVGGRKRLARSRECTDVIDELDAPIEVETCRLVSSRSSVCGLERGPPTQSLDGGLPVEAMAVCAVHKDAVRRGKCQLAEETHGGHRRFFVVLRTRHIFVTLRGAGVGVGAGV